MPRIPLRVRLLPRLLKVNARIVRRWRAGAKPGPGHLVNLFDLAAGMGLLHLLLPSVEEPDAEAGEARYRAGLTAKRTGSHRCGEGRADQSTRPS